MEVIDIKRIKEIRSQITKLKAEEKMLLKPSMTDLSMVGHIIEIIERNDRKLHVYSQMNSTTKRQTKIFILLWMYSPGTLLGDAMPIGLRKVIAGKLSSSLSRISDYAHDVGFLWLNSSDFREHVEYLWCEVQASLDLESSMGP